MAAASPPSTDERVAMLARFTAFLGSFRLVKFSAMEHHNAITAEFDALDVCSVSSLSLTTLSDDEHQHCYKESKNEIEKHATTNLSRPLIYRKQQKREQPSISRESCISDSNYNYEKAAPPTTLEEEGPSLKPFQIQNAQDIPELVLANLEASVCTLVDARLRAYATFLTQHGLSLAADGSDDAAIFAIEQKLVMLVQLTNEIKIENVVTLFELLPEEDESPSSDDSKNTTTTALPLKMKTTMDVRIPNPPGGNSKLVTLEADARGTISGTFHSSSNRLTEVQVRVDTHQLLAQLINRASFLVSSIVDHLTCQSKNVAKPVVTVSPELLPEHKSSSTISSFSLTKSTTTEQACTLLSAESCADIVDSAIGDLVPDMISPRPTKRLKTSSL